MVKTPYVYEIEFDVCGDCREKYEEWLAAEAIEWIVHESVAGFESYHNEPGMSPETKLIFEFESFEEWAEFVTSTEHDARTDSLESGTEQLNATLWHRGGLCLDGQTSTHRH